MTKSQLEQLAAKLDQLCCTLALTSQSPTMMDVCNVINDIRYLILESTKNS